MSDTSSQEDLWAKQSPGRVHKVEAAKPAKAQAAKKAPAKKA
jgi:hypothetical protein